MAGVNNIEDMELTGTLTKRSGGKAIGVEMTLDVASVKKLLAVVNTGDIVKSNQDLFIIELRIGTESVDEFQHNEATSDEDGKAMLISDRVKTAKFEGSLHGLTNVDGESRKFNMNIGTIEFTISKRLVDGDEDSIAFKNASAIMYPSERYSIEVI
ncbi:MAG: hypothetical protein LUH23_03990 [Oscillospiraceae bacterium]|nr:hypothetical protein [Oscillospiraceae bacterium]